MKGRGVPIVVSAPSGGGKTTLCRALLARIEGAEFSVSYTTRALRGNEQDGHDYHFVDDATFDAMIEEDEFLEWAHVHGRRYGSGLTASRKKLDAGTDIFFDIDIQGGQQIAERLPGAILVYIVPPDMKVLRERLEGRNSDAQDEIERRMVAAKDEMRQAQFYSHFIVNDDLETAVSELQAVVISERLRRVDKARLIDSIIEGDTP